MSFRRSMLALVLVAGIMVPAAAEDISEMLPQEAIVSIWIRDLPELVEGIKRFIPPLANQMPDAVELLAQGGLPAEVAASPMAVVVLPPAQKYEEPQVVVLFSSPKAEEYLGQMEDIGDGILEHPDMPLYMFSHKGHVAFSGDKDSLEAFRALEGVAYVPNKDSKAMLDKALVYVNFNVAPVLEMIEEDDMEMMKNNPDMAVALKMLELAEEVTSIDTAFSFDEQGLMIEAAVSTVDDSVIKTYAKPADAALGNTNLAKPSVLHLENFMFYDSSVIYQIFNDIMLKEGIMKFLLEEAEKQGTLPEMDVAGLVKATEEMMAEQMAIFGSQISNVIALTPAGLQFVQVQEVRQPEKVVAFIQKSIEVSSKTTGMNFQFAYDPDFTTIDGVKVGKMEYDFAKLEMPIPQPMSDVVMKGVRDLLQTDKLVLNTAVVDGYYVTTVGDGVMERQIALMRGKGEEQAVTTDPTVKQMIAKIGTEHNDISLISPVRCLEMVTRFLAATLNKPAPFTLPYATPVATGIAFGSEAPLKVRMYFPQACVTEIMVAGMSASKIFEEAFTKLFMGGMNGMGGGDGWGDEADEDWDWN